MTDQNREKLQEILGDRYEVQHLIYRGGMGEVYLGRHRQLGSKVAIKIMTQKLSSDPEQKKRFHREAKLYASLRHPNIIPISDFGTDEFFDYMVFPFIDGLNLQEKLEENGPLDVDEAVEIVMAVAKALAYANDNDVIHRDVKPSNIMIEKNSNILMADFGISKNLNDIELTQPGAVLGSPKYMSPEQILGKGVDSRSDQYALGIIFYEMLTGRFPFSVDDVNALFYSHVNETPVLPPDIAARAGDEVTAIIDRLCAKNPDDRYGSFHELIRELKFFQADKTEIRRELPPGAGAALSRRKARSSGRALIVVAAVVILAVFMGGGYYFYTAGIADKPVPAETAEFLPPAQIAVPPVLENAPTPTATPETPEIPAPDPAGFKDAETRPAETEDAEFTPPAMALVREQLQNFGMPDTEGWFQIRLNKTEFQVGDEIVYTLNAARDCHVVLLDFSTENELVQLFPNRFHPDSRLRKGEIYTIPERGAFEVTGPAGSETVIGFAGESAFSFLTPDFSQAPFLGVDRKDTEALAAIQENLKKLAPQALMRKILDFQILE